MSQTDFNQQHLMERWRLMTSVVTDVIHDWDPYGLLKSGCPKDEWNDEITRIVARIRHIHSPEDATTVISEVFSEAFHAERFGPPDCADVGKKLFDALDDSSLISRDK